jgi:hypothetical protein
MEYAMPRTAPKDYRDLLKIWNDLAQFLQKLYVALGATATITSLVIATFTSELTPLGVKIASFLLALALGLISAFEIGAKASAARGAWRLLNAAILAYENDESYTIQDLFKQYQAGEAMMGDIKYNAPEVKPLKPE